MVAIDAYGDLAVAADLHALPGDVFGTEVIQLAAMPQKRRHARIAATADRIFGYTLRRCKGTHVQSGYTIRCAPEDRDAGRIYCGTELGNRSHVGLEGGD